MTESDAAGDGQDEPQPQSPPVDIKNLVAYCSSLASEFTTKRNRVRHFIPNNAASGAANEAILRSFLASIAARAWAVTEGFVCNPIRGEWSRQCDILMYDPGFPLVSSESGVTIVWPESTRMVIEVKTSMTRVEDLKEALENIASVKRLRAAEHVIGVIFAFDSLTVPRVMEELGRLAYDAAHRPAAILLFNRGAIIQEPDMSQVLMFGGHPSASYELRRCTAKDRSGAVLVYLLLLFFRGLFHYGRGWASSEDFQTATQHFLAQNTAPE